MRFNDFTELLNSMDERFPNNAAIRFEKDGALCAMTYRELHQAVLKRAGEFRQDPCSCVGLYLRPSPEWVVAMFASAIAGKRTVLLDVSVPLDKVQLLVGATGVDKLITDDPDAGKTVKLCPVTDGPVEDAGCLLFFTSGTTSMNKAVVLTQRALCGSAWNGQQVLPCTETDTVLSIVPLSHVFGFVCTLLWPLTNGGAVAFGRGIRSAAMDPAFFKATILSLVPSLLKYLIAADAFNPELRCILIGASPCDQETYQAIMAKGIEIRCGYGLTETASGLAMSPKGAPDPFAMELCPDTKVRLGSDGEVLIRTTCMMEGYYHNPASTNEVLRDGELSTGDIGKIDENGRLLIVGRKNDVLVLPNGEKVFCLEMEEELSKLLGTETAVRLDGAKLILVVSSPDGKEEDYLSAIDEYNKNQPIGRRIAGIIVTEQKLPRTATGKLQRWKLNGITG